MAPANTLSAGRIGWGVIALFLTTAKVGGAESAQSPSVTEAAEISIERGRDTCLVAHRQAQVDRRERKLLEAREQLKICSNRDCPVLLHGDCVRWTNELEQQLPSVIVEILVGKKQATDAAVFIDDVPARPTLAGQALALNPGKHLIRVELPTQPAKEVEVVVYEGQQYQRVEFEFDAQPAVTAAAAPQPKPVASPVERDRPVPKLAWILGGVGTLGLAGFAGFGLWGYSRERELDRDCTPICAEGSADSVRTRYLIGDISLAVGGLALLGAGISYATRPTEERTVAVGVTPLQGGASAVVQWYAF